MTRNPILFFLALAFISNPCRSQTQRNVNPCAPQLDSPAAAAFNIPASKCQPSLPAKDDALSRIRREFRLDAEWLSASSFRLRGVTIVEVICYSHACEVTGLLFCIDSKGVVSVSPGYPLSLTQPDFRKEMKRGGFTLYRQLSPGGSTVCFELDCREGKLNCFLDDGLSKW